MGSELARAVDVRARAARWLLETRFPDWDLALVSVGETHSINESLWHGIDPTHPLHLLPSAGPAAESVRAVYRAVDRLIGDLISAFPDAQVVLFAMGGMGINHSDVPSMLLLPELLYRYAFGSAYFNAPPEWSSTAGAYVVPPPDAVSWGHFVEAGFPPIPEPRSSPRGLRSLAASMLPRSVKSVLRSAIGSDARRRPLHVSLRGWPATRYQPFWPKMAAFAPHSYYDGSIRLNLAGRERQGIVSAGDYQRVLAKVEGLVRACIDPATGKSAVDLVERPATGDPFSLASTQSDLTVVWKGAATCFEHPDLGRIGPVPYRRTGGHTGPLGMAFIRSGRLPVGEWGLHSSFDVVPTIVELLGQRMSGSISGKSLSPSVELVERQDRRRFTSITTSTSGGSRNAVSKAAGG